MIVKVKFFLFEDVLTIFKFKILVGYRTLIDNYLKKKFDLDYDFEQKYLFHQTIGVKKNFTNKNSSLLWHKRLEHISIERMKRLVKEGFYGILILLTNFKDCIDFIKGKQTKINSKGSIDYFLLLV